MGDTSKIFGISVRAFIAIILTIFVCAMSGLQIKINEPLHSAFLLSLGFYFGQKSDEKKGGSDGK